MVKLSLMVGFQRKIITVWINFLVDSMKSKNLDHGTTKLKQKDIRGHMVAKRKMIPSTSETHAKVLEYLKAVKQTTGLKWTISSFYESAVTEKIQRDKHKRILS